MDLLLKNCRTLAGEKDIYIKDGIFTKIIDSGTEHDFGNCEIRDLAGAFVIPGITDPHVHVRDLNQKDKEDWLSCSQAALNGGVTTIFDMPNTIPATDNLESLNVKREVAEKSLVNYKFYLGANNDNIIEIDSILSSKPKDIAGIKLFLSSSSSNDIIDNRISIVNLFKLAKKYDVVVAIHTEMQRCLNKWNDKIKDKTIENHNQIRNRECAIEGTELVLDIAEKVGNKVLICHVSTKEELDLIREAKKKDVQVFCEVSPHHLMLNETIVKIVGNFAKVNPPLRTKEDNLALLEAINDGTVDLIGTDHAPHQLTEKQQDYSLAPSGFPGLETMLPILLNEVNKKNITLDKVVELTSANANNIFDLENKNILAEGYDANFVIIDLDKKQIIKPENFKSKAKYSPFANTEVTGAVIETFVNRKKNKKK